jgi:hypothetical protein
MAQSLIAIDCSNRIESNWSTCFAIIVMLEYIWQMYSVSMFRILSFGTRFFYSILGHYSFLKFYTFENNLIN